MSSPQPTRLNVATLRNKYHFNIIRLPALNVTESRTALIRIWYMAALLFILICISYRDNELHMLIST